MSEELSWFARLGPWILSLIAGVAGGATAAKAAISQNAKDIEKLEAKMDTCITKIEDELSAKEARFKSFLFKDGLSIYMPRSNCSETQTLLGNNVLRLETKLDRLASCLTEIKTGVATLNGSFQQFKEDARNKTP
jgi:hypothetical protein